MQNFQLSPFLQLQKIQQTFAVEGFVLIANEREMELLLFLAILYFKKRNKIIIASLITKYWLVIISNNEESTKEREKDDHKQHFWALRSHFFAPCFFLNISINCGLGGLFSLKNLEQNGNFYKQNDSQLNCGFSFDKSMFSLSNSIKNKQN